MAHKVLVFESDAAFAGELRNELGKLNCSTYVVDDGNVGLQQAASDRPDLILLSIELPRMNGFSVCNKLKKDAALKDVPLIIMSSESSDETFEQHRKLRTRAEDYVHKPIAFGELLTHIRAFVPVGNDAVDAVSADNDAIVIEDEAAVQTYTEEDEDEGTELGVKPTFASQQQHASSSDDAEMDAAFGRMTDAPEMAAPDTSNSASATSSSTITAAPEVERPSRTSRVAPPPLATPSSSGPVSTRGGSSPPRPTGVDNAELDRVRGELERAKTRATDLDRDLSNAKAEIGRLQDDLQRGARSGDDAQKMQREIDDLKAKLANAGKAGGGVSSREFLDLREALNKKDKEILSLKEAVGKKEKETLESRDRGLSLEREKGELEDRTLAADREIADLRDKNEALAADKEQAKKAGEDLKARLARTQADVEAKQKEIADLKSKQAEESATSDAKAAALRADQQLALENAQSERNEERDRLTAEHASALEELTRDRDAKVQEATDAAERDVAQAKDESAAALAKAKEDAAREKAQAIAVRESELQASADSKLAALHRAHQDELQRTRVEADRLAQEASKEHNAALDAAANAAAAALAARESELADQHTANAAAQKADHDSKVAGLERDHSARVRALEEDRDETVKALETDRDDKIRALEEDRDSRVRTIESERDEKIAALENDRDAKLMAIETRLSRELEDTRAVADAQKAAADQQITELEANLKSTKGALEESERNLQTARDRGVSLDAALASTKGELEETKQRLATETTRANAAFAKWDNDKTSLDRAKDALAVALSQIEEAEARSISGN